MRNTTILVLAALVACDNATIPEVDQVAVLVGAGDIASCSSDGDEATAAILDTIQGVVFTTGDNVYPYGNPEEYSDCYGVSWGRHLSRTRPAIGNHELIADPTGSPYYDYFGARAGPRGLGYYSYEVGEWWVFALNSMTSMAKDSPQYNWLLQELAEVDSPCTLAYWHHPRFSSSRHGDNEHVAPIWEALQGAGAELVLAGHDHTYERFATQSANGEYHPNGIRQIVVGTGGRSLYSFDRVAPNSEVRIAQTYGVLKLTLFPERYHFEFISTNGEVLDEGTHDCH